MELHLLITSPSAAAAASSCSPVLCMAGPWPEKALILQRQRCAATPHCDNVVFVPFDGEIEGGHASCSDISQPSSAGRRVRVKEPKKACTQNPLLGDLMTIKKADEMTQI
jgi:hypothetical protein